MYIKLIYKLKALSTSTELLAGINKEVEGVIPMIDLRYDEEAGSFYNKDYQALVDKVLRCARGKVWPTLVIDEIKKNLYERITFNAVPARINIRDIGKRTKDRDPE